MPMTIQLSQAQTLFSVAMRWLQHEFQ
jgi:hypothetical protein